jgi:hypothetical protein
LAQRGQPFQDFGVFGVAGRVELLDHGVFVGGIGKAHPQDAGGAALMVDPVGQPPHFAEHLGSGGQQAHRLLQIQGAERTQLAPHLHPQRARRARG